ncbi:synaptic vesicle transporter [Eremomyces bilateralis CBS 781.70]|uniref:Synaptic vesicle transporter n=1 Tax=Eremomyces bilateralis CBS 781.70 TaxID=1392243 RepID=A0A6G1GCY5_9PEZI|nr:synaptic vesicle transporter [Eremomyces bilateralis CBS 781.70]KAF1815955.1 synaptic vesicle transporter [Eremomyces bilateralis CBS 781.70]
MGLWILDDTKLDHVPGTAFVLDDEDRSRMIPADPNLKYDRSGKTPIILVPQPSDDPNDPLNWPLWQRDLILFLLSLLSVIASTLSPVLAAITLKLSLLSGRTFNDVALLTGWHLLGVGVAGFLFVPSARVWGKRHCYLIGCVFIIFSSAWGGAAGTDNFVSLTWARVFQGVGLAPFEALVNASVGDLYFVHQRAKRMALSNLALFGGAFFTPVIVGRMAKDMGWPWCFYFVAIFSGVMLPILILFIPETAFRRDAKLNTDTQVTLMGQALVNDADIVIGDSNTNPQDSVHDSMEKPSNESSAAPVPAAESTLHGQRDSFVKRMMPFNGRKTDENLFKLLLRPLPLFFHPSIIWACLIQGTLIGWTVFLGIVLAAIMLGPPLFFDEVKTGYMYTGAFIGAFFGFLIAGIVGDLVPAWMTKKNKGVYEPEFRLVLVIPQLILGCAGLYGFGVTANNTWKYGWVLPDFFFGLEVAGMVIGAVASALYIVDAHRNISIEGFTCMMVFKNVFSFGLTFRGYQWLVESGIKHIFVILGSVQVAVCATTILLYIFGKKNRSFFARYDILKMLNLW